MKFVEKEVSWYNSLVDVIVALWGLRGKITQPYSANPVM